MVTQEGKELPLGVALLVPLLTRLSRENLKQDELSCHNKRVVVGRRAISQAPVLCYCSEQPAHLAQEAALVLL